jgi:hypothetical protein
MATTLSNIAASSAPELSGCGFSAEVELLVGLALAEQAQTG